MNFGYGISAELFQILKDDVVKVLPQYASKFEKLSSGHRTGKGVFIPIPKKDNAMNVQTTSQMHSFHKLAK